MKRLIYIFTISAVFFLWGCSVTKQVPHNDALFRGAVINLKQADKNVHFNKKTTKAELASLLRPNSNKKFLGIHFKLRIYNMVDTPKKKSGFKYWLKYKVGEPPVLASNANLEKNRTLLQNRLENKGYFHTQVTVDTIVKNRKMLATYTSIVRQQYFIRNVFFPSDSGQIYNVIRNTSSQSVLKKDKPYNLESIRTERERIDKDVKEGGFYYFNPEDIIVDVDSTVGDHKVDMYVRIKKEASPRALVSYSINDVVVYADYTVNSDTSRVHLDTSTKYEGYYIMDPKEKFSPKIFPRTLVFKPGDRYNRTDHATSLNRLVSLGVYKFVKVRFEETDTARKPSLNAFYYLSTMPKKSFSLGLSGLTKSNNSTGTDLTLSWKNRNLLRSAEIFTVSLSGGYEKQVSAQQDVNTITAGVDFNLYVPRFITPFFTLKGNSAFVPQTVFSAGYELFSRDTQYTLNSIKASIGYMWKDNIRKQHQLKIYSMNYVRPSDIDSNYQHELDTNITLARSIEEQFIMGPNYNFNYNSQVASNLKKNNFYFNGNIDVSGLLPGLITGANAKTGNRRNFLGVPFSQYIRAEADVRHFLRVGNSSALASRFLAGAGYAFGNSLTMPFIKQFFAGGASSVRAFRARGLGPGTYYGGNAKDSFIADQPGDIRFELNIEYRVKLVSVLHGAVFADAGNIWLFEDDPYRPGGKFTDNFIKQFAVGAGAGLRVDVSFFVLRADLAFPIRKPYIDGGKWVFDQIDFNSNEWRRNNLLLNFAIGYPF